MRCVGGRRVRNYFANPDRRAHAVVRNRQSIACRLGLSGHRFSQKARRLKVAAPTLPEHLKDCGRTPRRAKHWDATASVPIPKFVSVCGTLVRTSESIRTLANLLLLVPPLNRSSHRG